MVGIFYNLVRHNPGLQVFIKDFTLDEFEAMRPLFKQEYLQRYGETNEEQHERMLLTTARKAG